MCKPTSRSLSIWLSSIEGSVGLGGMGRTVVFRNPLWQDEGEQGVAQSSNGRLQDN